MTRQSIDGGGWIDLSTARRFPEETHWNGNNQISVNTGTQWGHEDLYRSQGGAYVLKTWSQYQGSLDKWTRIGLDEAVAWLLLNEYEPNSAAELAIVAGLEV